MGVERDVVSLYEPACLTCSAKTWVAERNRYECFPEKLNARNANGRLTAGRPWNCPIMRNNPTSAYEKQSHAILKSLLRKRK